MAIRDYQASIQLNRLYEIKINKGGLGLGEALAPRISSQGGGTIDVYFSDSSSDPASLSEMNLEKDNLGIGTISSIPVFIAVAQNTATVSEVIISGIEIVRDIGPIS